MSTVTDFVICVALPAFIVFAVVLCASAFGEALQAIGWCLIAMASLMRPPAEDVRIFEALSYSLTTAVWLAAGGGGLAWAGTFLLGGAGPSLAWGVAAFGALVALWWLATIELRDVRNVVRESRGIPATPWQYLKDRRRIAVPRIWGALSTIDSSNPKNPASPKTPSLCQQPGKRHGD